MKGTCIWYWNVNLFNYKVNQRTFLFPIFLLTPPLLKKIFSTPFSKICGSAPGWTWKFNCWITNFIIMRSIIICTDNKICSWYIGVTVVCAQFETKQTEESYYFFSINHTFLLSSKYSVQTAHTYDSNNMQVKSPQYWQCFAIPPKLRPLNCPSWKKYGFHHIMSWSTCRHWPYLYINRYITSLHSMLETPQP